MSDKIEKVCRLCGEEKPIDEFYRAPGTVDGRRGECRSCFQQQRLERFAADPQKQREAAERTARWRAENPDRYAANQERFKAAGKHKAALRKHFLKKKYGLTLEGYDELLRRQGGVCALCGDPPKEGQHLHVDHCHDTGDVRGLLCFRCNAGMGMLRHDPALLIRAAEYVATRRRVAALRREGAV